jgi:hypothetical protein
MNMQIKAAKTGEENSIIPAVEESCNPSPATRFAAVHARKSVAHGI